jgi:hypothetical protein
MSARRPPSIDRRRFLEVGAAASLGAALTDVSGAAARAIARDSSRLHARAPEPGGLKAHAVIYDERFLGARRFAEAVRRLGVPVQPIRGDATQLWYAWLYPLWKRAPSPIAGLTAYAAMFCLERLAWDRRLRMMQCAAGDAADASEGWPIERAAMIARGIGAGTFAGPRRGAAADALASAAAGPLHFWVIAPRAQLATLTA